MSGPADAFRPSERGASFPLSNKLERVAFRAAWLVLARFTPPALFAWRAAILRLFGAQIGNGARIYPTVKVWLPRNLVIGEGALIAGGVELYNQGRITVGPHSVISQRAFLCASTHRLSDPLFALVLRPIVVGRGCWIAAEAFIGPGVSIGDGAAVAARAALFEDAAEMAVYRGNPATALKPRRFNAP